MIQNTNLRARFARAFLGFSEFVSLHEAPASPEAGALQRRERLVASGLAVLALGVYAWTLCPGVFPGTSAAACAGVLQALPGEAFAGHPLWAQAARLAARLPVGELPVRLNLFSALCGAGAVALVFRLTARLLCEALREEVWSPQMEGGEGADTRAPVDPSAHRQAVAGGVVAALAFAFCTPFWSASVSLHAQTFDLLLLLAAACLFARHCFSGAPACLLAVAFLCGLGLIESVSFVAFLPGILGVFAYNLKRREPLSGAFFGNLTACFGAGVGLALLPLVLAAACGESGLSGAALGRIAAGLAGSHAAELAEGFPRNGRLPLALQGVVPVVTVFWGARSFCYLRDSQTGWAWAAVNTLFAALAALTLLNLPGSCGLMAREGLALPVLPLLGLAMTCGGLFVYGLLQGRPPSREAVEDDYEHAEPVPRFAGLLLAGAVALVVLAAPFRNFKDADGRHGAFADAFCREVLAAAPQAACWLTDGRYDASLLVQARLAHRQVALLTAPAKGAAASPKAAPMAFDRMLEQLRNNPGEAGRIALLAVPARWAETGVPAVPDRLVYRAGKPQEQPDPAALLNRHRAFWRQIGPLLADDPGRSPALSRLHRAMRMQASRVANDLGVTFLRENALAEADEAFHSAQALDAGNLCALLNQYALYGRWPDIGNAETLQGRLSAFAAGPAKLKALADYESDYGSLHLPGVEYLAHRWLAGQVQRQPAPAFAPLLESLTEYCRAAVLALGVLSPLAPPSTRRAANAELEAVARKVMNGKWRDAETQLREMTRRKRNLLPAWALLAEVLISKGAFDTVQKEILPAMHQATGRTDRELIDLTEGRLALCGSPPDAATAYASFMRALQAAPENEEAQNGLLKASQALGNTLQLETDCASLLVRPPSQALAQALLGGLHLNQGRLKEAEAALSASIAARPTANALHNLARTLRQAGRYEAAEAAVRRAILLNPGLREAWETLALILRQGADEVAHESIGK